MPNDDNDNGVDCVPFLSGKVQFELPQKKLIPIHSWEGLARGHSIAIFTALNAFSLVDAIKNHDHPNFKSQKHLDEIELNKTKCFMPKCFRHWSGIKIMSMVCLSMFWRRRKIVMMNSLIISLQFLIFLCRLDVVAIVEDSKVSFVVFVDTFVSVGMRQSDLTHVLNYLMCMQNISLFSCVIERYVEIMRLTHQSSDHKIMCTPCGHDHKFNNDQHECTCEEI